MAGGFPVKKLSASGSQQTSFASKAPNLFISARRHIDTEKSSNDRTDSDVQFLASKPGGLPCPGSMVVAERGLDNSELNPLIKSRHEDPSPDTETMTP
jgi:hypothetical protein